MRASAGGDPRLKLTLFVEVKSPDRCWFQTRLFNLSYPGGTRTPNAAQRSLLKRLVERISQWEVLLLSGRGGSPAAPGVRARH